MVKKLGNIRGFVARNNEGVVVTAQPLTKLANLLSKILYRINSPTHYRWNSVYKAEIMTSKYQP